MTDPSIERTYGPQDPQTTPRLSGGCDWGSLQHSVTFSWKSDKTACIPDEKPLHHALHNTKKKIKHTLKHLRTHQGSMPFAEGGTPML